LLEGGKGAKLIPGLRLRGERSALFFQFGNGLAELLCLVDGGMQVHFFLFGFSVEQVLLMVLPLCCPAI
jgi:hypothetical protein